MDHPTARGNVLDGPATEWFPDGTIKSHGRFAMRDGRSVPDGVWTFWYPSGERKIQGRYVAGVPIGCFGVWDNAGALRTVVPVDGGFVSSDCTIAIDREASKLAATYGGPEYVGPPDTSLGGEVFSAALQVGMSPDSLPITADEMTQYEASIQQDLRVQLRRRVGWAKVGANAGVTMTDQPSNWGVSAGGLASVSIPTGIDWIDVELSAELGAHLYAWVPRAGDARAVTHEHLTVAYGDAQAAVGVRLTDNLALYTVVNAKRDLARTAIRTNRWCSDFTCRDVNDTWHVGGTQLGAALQLRFLVK